MTSGLLRKGEDTNGERRLTGKKAMPGVIQLQAKEC